MISALRQMSKFEFRTFLKKNQIFGFPWCSTREDLSIDVSIINVGLILTKSGRFFFSAYGNSGYGQNSILSISNFLKKFHKKKESSKKKKNPNFLKEIEKAKVISAFRQKSKFEFRTFLKKKKNPIFGFPWCSTREDLSIDVSITNVGLI